MMVGVLGIYATPYLVGYAIDVLHYPAAQAGWIASLEIGGVAAGSLVVAPFVAGLRQRRLALVATLLVVLSNLLSGLAPTALLYGATRLVSGFACGLVLAVVTACIAATGDAERTYGQVYAGMSVMAALLLYLLPGFQAGFGPAGLFGGLALASASLALGVSGLPESLSAPAMSTAASRPLRWSRVALLFASMTLAFATYGAVYAFSGRIATDLGMGSKAMGAMLAASTLSAILGSGIAGFLGTRWGRSLPLCGAMLLAALTYLVILGVHSAPVLVVGMIAYGLMTMFFNAYAYGAAAGIDPSGRVSTALQGYSLVPYAIGPGVLGSLAGQQGYSGLAWPAFLINLVAIAVVLPVVLGLDREEFPRPVLQAGMEVLPPKR